MRKGSTNIKNIQFYRLHLVFGTYIQMCILIVRLVRWWLEFATTEVAATTTAAATATACQNSAANNKRLQEMVK